MITRWDDYGAAWERHGEALVQVLDITKAAHVTTAFECLASLARSSNDDGAKAAAVAQSSIFTTADSLLAKYVKAAEVAKLITLRASFHWWEVKARRHALAGTAREVELQRQQRDRQT